VRTDPPPDDRAVLPNHGQAARDRERNLHPHRQYRAARRPLPGLDPTPCTVAAVEVLRPAGSARTGADSGANGLPRTRAAAQIGEPGARRGDTGTRREARPGTSNRRGGAGRVVPKIVQQGEAVFWQSWLPKTWSEPPVTQVANPHRP